jgi:hypothetical protein
LPQWPWQRQNEHTVEVAGKYAVETFRDLVRAKTSLDANDLLPVSAAAGAIN